MDYELEHSRIEQRNRELHKQGAETEQEGIAPLTKENFDVPNDFPDAIIDKSMPKQKSIRRKSMKFLQWFALVTISSAVGAIGYFVYKYLDPSERPSEKNIEFTINSPVGINPGEPVDINFKVQNRNNIALDGAEVVLSLPIGSYETKDGNIVPVRESKINIGIINAGDTIDRNVKLYILGGEQELKTIKGHMSYRFINMNSVFTKDTTSEVRILASPVAVVVDTLKRATAGREVKTTINVRSNTEVPLENILLSVEYPSGYLYNNAEPRPVIGNGLWVIPKLERSNSATFVIDGMFSSEGSEERIIRTQIGISDDVNPNKIVSKYQEVLTPISLEAPFVDITTTYNGKSPSNVVANYGVRMSGVVTVKNNTKERINHAVVEVSISGTGVDEKTIDSSNGGVFRSENNTITWDERNDKSLLNMGPGESVQFAFSFVPDSGRSNGQFVANPEIATNILVKAERENEQGVMGEVRTLSASVVKVATQTEFTGRALYFNGPIKNIGEVPPRVEKDTQFTIIWNIRNTSNSLEAGEVRAVLPPTVSWSNVIYPTKEVVRYDETTHEVIWFVGSVPAGTGVGSVSPKEVAFQVVLTPTKDDVGSYPIILKDQVFRAIDSFTKKQIEIKQGSLNTMLSSDTKANRTTGKVAN